MEVLIFIGIAWFIWSMIAGHMEKQEEEKRMLEIQKLLREAEEERKRNVFKCRVIDDKYDGEEFDWEEFHVQMKGIVEGNHDNFKVKYIVQMLDITDEKSAILSTMEVFQSEESTNFWFESKTDILPYESTIFKDWSTTVRIPKIFLEYPRSGSRKIEFKVFVVNALNDKILTQARTTVQYFNSEKGYKDKYEDREYFEEMVVKAAMLVSASDGTMDRNEASVIKAWIQKKIAFYKDEFQDTEKDRLNQYIKEAYSEIENSYLDIYEVLDGINNIATEGEKYELFQVCLDVAKADGEADENELEIIHDIADYIKLDEKQFKSMIEKELPITMHTSAFDDESILGIKPGMSEKEIKNSLREQYQKWNARVASADADIREQAETMIQLIAKTREKYVN